MIELIAKVLLIALLKLSIASEIESPVCGQFPQHNLPQLTHSIITRYWPWHAALFYRSTNSSLTYKCGGTLISENWILTAAHCVFQNGASVNPNEISLSLGRLNLTANESRSEQSFDAIKIIVHENYVPSYFDNDIALIQLSHTATYNHFVQPICLWKSNETDLSHVVDKYGTVVGWGTTENYQLSEVLQEARFIVVAQGRCLESNRDFYKAFLTERNFCAGLRNGTSVCEGDSGGSMTFEEGGSYYIRGIVSSSPSKTNHTTQQLDCDTMEYAIYTDVAMHLQWIDDNTEIGCQAMCLNYWWPTECTVNVPIRFIKRMCEITFDEMSDSSAITSLIIGGEMKSIPDISDAVTKFKNLEILSLSFIELQYVEREKLTPFKGIKKLDLSYNQIAQLHPDTFTDLKELRTLLLKNNLITELQPDTFKELTNLAKLNLNRNRLSNLPQNLFRNNRKLKKIDLSENRLQYLHVDVFKELDNLEFLDLNENKIPELSPGLFRNNQKLQKIDLTTNSFYELHVDAFKQLGNLKIILLKELQLADLPQEIFRSNKELQKIDLSENSLTEVYVDTFQELENLTELDLGLNQLEDLPEGLFDSNKKLRKINLGANLLSDFPVDTYTELDNLEIINLSVNELETLPKSLFRNNKELQHIYINHNRLTILHVDLFKVCKNLQIIKLHENKLRELPSDIFKELYNLTVLDLHGNDLIDLPRNVFGDNLNLQKIDLERNGLKDLYNDTFVGLYNLSEIVLAGNKLEFLPEGLFRDNGNLIRIDLSENGIIQVQCDFSHLLSLGTLDMKGNVCIDESFEVNNSTRSEVTNKIRTKCPF